MNLEYDFVQVSKLSEDRKKGLHQKGKLFPLNSGGHLRSDACTPESNYWGDADVDHTQTIGEDTVKLLGEYIPPGFRHPWGLST